VRNRADALIEEIGDGKSASRHRLSSVNPEEPVKPPNAENPRQSWRFAWRMSYARFAILDRQRTKAPEPTWAFAL
jgi:hypothetical protein